MILVGIGVAVILIVLGSATFIYALVSG